MVFKMDILKIDIKRWVKILYMKCKPKKETEI